VYQPVVRGSCVGRTVGIFYEATMVELWDSVCTAEKVGTHEAQEGASGWVQCSHWR
jgi:hypothetical protein